MELPLRHVGTPPVVSPSTAERVERSPIRYVATEHPHACPLTRKTSFAITDSPAVQPPSCLAVQRFFLLLHKTHFHIDHWTYSA